MEIRITCSDCKRTYILPIEFLEMMDSFDIICKTCNVPLKMPTSEQKKIADEIMGIIEDTQHTFLNLPDVKKVVNEMEKKK